jgi:hypothetical protein
MNGKKYGHRWNVPKHLRYKPGQVPFILLSDDLIIDRRDAGTYKERLHGTYSNYLKSGMNKSYSSYEQLAESHELWISDGSTDSKEWVDRPRRQWHVNIND